MPFTTEQNLLTNGAFLDGSTGWTETEVDPAIDSVRFVDDGVRFNANQDPSVGDSIEQTFATTVGQDLVMLLQGTSFQGTSTHDFKVEIFDDAGNLLASTDATFERNLIDHLTLTFTAVSETTRIVITNTGTSDTINSDGLIQRVGIFDTAEFDPVQIVGSGAASNRIQGTDLDDNMVGGGRQDTFFGSLGADTIDGASGTDRVDYSASDEGIIIDVGRGEFGEVGIGGLAEGDLLKNIEAVVGSEFDDVIIVNGSKLNLFGLGGDDSIVGSSNFDRIEGGDGDDTLRGGNQNDTLIGGLGNDNIEGE